MLKSSAKQILFAAAFVLALPLVLASWLESASAGPRSERVFGACKEILAAIPTLLGRYLRAAYYSACCTNVSSDVSMLFGSMIAHRETTVGRRVLIGSYSILGHCEVGDDVLISSRVSVLSGRYQHGRPEDRAERRGADEYETVRVGAGSWIGEGALVLANVGENCTIAAGAVLNKAAQDGSTMLGNPARRVDLAPPRTASS